MTFGDLEWATASGGRLSGLERLAQTWAGLRYRVLGRLRRHAATLAVGPAEAERMLAEVELPRTPLVDMAAGIVAERGPPPLVNHVLRTWAFGTVLGMRDGLTWYRECLAVAALLHDLALARRTPDRACFGADGALQAVELLEGWGASPAFIRRVGDAICLHLCVAVPTRLGVEAHLVNAGAAVDVVGARLRQILPAVREGILARHPRLDVKRLLADKLAEEHRRHPRSRAGFLVASGFLGLLRRAPFES